MVLLTKVSFGHFYACYRYILIVMLKSKTYGMCKRFRFSSAGAQSSFSGPAPVSAFPTTSYPFQPQHPAHSQATTSAGYSSISYSAPSGHATQPAPLPWQAPAGSDHSGPSGVSVSYQPYAPYSGPPSPRGVSRQQSLGAESSSHSQPHFQQPPFLPGGVSRQESLGGQSSHSQQAYPPQPYSPRGLGRQPSITSENSYGGARAGIVRQPPADVAPTYRAPPLGGESANSAAAAAGTYFRPAVADGGSATSAAAGAGTFFRPAVSAGAGAESATAAGAAAATYFHPVGTGNAAAAGSEPGSARWAPQPPPQAAAAVPGGGYSVAGSSGGVVASQWAAPQQQGSWPQDSGDGQGDDVAFWDSIGGEEDAGSTPLGPFQVFFQSLKMYGRGHAWPSFTLQSLKEGKHRIGKQQRCFS